jgi:TIR domain
VNNDYKFELSRRMPSYLRRLAKEYSVGDDAKLASVIEGSLFVVREETSFDNWNGGTYGHDLVLYVPDELIGFVPLDQQGELQEKLRQDLNKAASAVDNEFVEAVHFEYLDDVGSAPPGATALRPTQTAPVTAAGYSSVWQPDMVRLFISHRDTDKKIAHDLAGQLKRRGVSCFVAHDTIEPDEDWQKEIERALQTMDAMLAMITDSFFDSAWTNQEIGFALARGVPVISIKLGARDPVGFIRNRQAIKGSATRMDWNAADIFDVLAKRLPASNAIRKGVLDYFMQSPSFAESESRFEQVAKLSNLTDDEILALVKAHNDNAQLWGCWALGRDQRFLNFLQAQTKRVFRIKDRKIVEDDDEIPF